MTKKEGHFQTIIFHFLSLLLLLPPNEEIFKYFSYSKSIRFNNFVKTFFFLFVCFFLAIYQLFFSVFYFQNFVNAYGWSVIFPIVINRLLI